MRCLHPTGGRREGDALDGLRPQGCRQRGSDLNADLGPPAAWLLRKLSERSQNATGTALGMPGCPTPTAAGPRSPFPGDQEQSMCKSTLVTS